jgi:putative ABC transport system permease protein
MSIGPILKSLSRHRTAVFLIVAEIALTCAIVSNAVFLISERLDSMKRASGVAEDEIIRIKLSGIGEGADEKALTRTDLASLLEIPGVKHGALTNQVPFGNSSWNSDVRISRDTKDEVSVGVFLGTEDLVDTLGLELVAGRDFNPDEFVDFDAVQSADPVAIPSAIITAALAERLFPGKSAVGESVLGWSDEVPMRVVGVVDRLERPGSFKGAERQLSLLMPVRLTYNYAGAFILRVEPERRAEILEAAIPILERNDANRVVVDKQIFSELRDKFFENDRAMAWLLVAVCVALLLITALGIVGLASFWVQQRTRQIGVRRALGATRQQILAYFHTENLLLTTAGIAVGMIMAYGINRLLMTHYEVARLPASYLPIGAVLLVLLCQLAVLGPAMRAARVPPAVATRGTR